MAGLTLGAGGGDACKVKLAVPRTAWVDEFVAVIVRIACAATLAGAVYIPDLEIFPVAGLTVHATDVPEGRFSTENCWVREGAMVTVAGLTLVGGAAGGVAVSVKLAVPRTAWVEALVAVMVRICCAATGLGAM